VRDTDPDPDPDRATETDTAAGAGTELGADAGVGAEAMAGGPIYHLALAGEWEEARAGGRGYRRSTLGRSLEDEGFVHCSFGHQVRPTAERFYAGRDDVVVLVVDPGRLIAPVKVEPASDQAGADVERFPHVYGPLDLDAVVDIVALDDFSPSGS
jgi:uncharacterized protein (DUF952 family)